MPTPEERMLEKAKAPVLQEQKSYTDRELEQQAIVAMQAKSGLKDALGDSEFWKRDVLGHATTAVKNIAAQVAGFPSDVAGAMLAIQAIDPVKKKMLNIESPWDAFGLVPGNSEQIANAIGGDPTDPTWLPAGILAPGPGEIKAAASAAVPLATALRGAVKLAETLGSKPAYGLTNMFIGGQGADNLIAAAAKGNIKPIENIARKQEAARLLEAGENRLDVWNKTGWWQGSADKELRFVLSDKDAVVNLSALSNKVELNRTSQTQVVEGTLQELFSHPTLFEAFPQLRNVRLTFHVTTRIDDTGTAYFTIYNPEAARRGLSGKAGTDPAGPFVTVYNANDEIEIKETVLHEIQHIVQKIEGFAQGSNSDVFFSSFKDAREMQMDIEIINQIKKGNLGLFNEEEDVLRAADRLVKKYEAPPEEVLAAIDDLSRYEDEALDNALLLRKQVLDKSTNDIAILLAELKGYPDKASELINALPLSTLRRLSLNRYLLEAGEIEARLTSHISKLSQEEIAKIKDIDALTRTMSETPVRMEDALVR